MLPRENLKQCFQCKNNIECWGLNEDIPFGLNERENSIKPDALSFLLVQNMGNDLNIGEQFGILCMGFLANIRADEKATRRDVYQLLSLLCAICNTPNDGWHCPAEDPLSEEKYSFEKR
jgi:hypothetical protein